MQTGYCLVSPQLKNSSIRKEVHSLRSLEILNSAVAEEQGILVFVSRKKQNVPECRWHPIDLWRELVTEGFSEWMHTLTHLTLVTGHTKSYSKMKR